MEQFRKLNPSEKKGILREVHQRRISISFKFPDSGVLRMKPSEQGWGDSIIGARPATLGESRKGQTVTGQFQVNGEFYFFSAKVRILRQVVHLDLLEGIHKLIRRRNLRIHVPASMALNMLTKRVGARLSFLRGPVQDISMKGIRIAFHGTEGIPQKEDIVAGTLKFGVRQPLELVGIVRHSRRVSKSHFDYIVGIEIMECSDDLRYQSWLVEIHREVYSRKGHS